MPEPGHYREPSFDPLWLPEEGQLPLWLRTVVQEAFGDPSDSAPRELKKEIVEGEEVDRVFKALKSSRESWTEPEFIDAVLGDKRWKRLLLEYLVEKHEEKHLGLEEVTESVKKIKEAVENLDELQDKIKKFLDKVKEILKSKQGALKSAGSTAIAAGTGAAAGIAIGYILWHTAMKIRPELDQSRVQPISIPILIQPTVKPEIHLSGITAQLQSPIPITLHPEIKIEKIDPIPVEVKLTPMVGTTAPPGNGGSAPLEIHITGGCCESSGQGVPGTDSPTCAPPPEPKTIQMESGTTVHFELRGFPKLENACTVDLRVKKVVEKGVRGIHIKGCGLDLDTLDLALDDPISGKYVWDKIGWQLTLDAIQHPSVVAKIETAGTAKSSANLHFSRVSQATECPAPSPQKRTEQKAAHSPLP
jgi:hypothetical protein